MSAPVMINRERYDEIKAEITKLTSENLKLTAKLRSIAGLIRQLSAAVVLED